MFSPSLPEILIVCFVVLLLFGKRLPGVMHSIGKSVVEFKKGVKAGEDDEANQSVEHSDSSTTPKA